MAEYHPLLIDKRIVDRNIAKGLIKRKDFEKHLESLADAGENAEMVSFEPPEPSQEASKQGD